MIRTAHPIRFVVFAVAACASQGSALAACPEPPAPIRDIDATRFYVDADGTKVDPALAAKHEAEVKPLADFLRYVSKHADRAVAKNDKTAAACALKWLAAWAEGRAWLGTMGSKQSEYQRKWDLAGASLAYLKVKPFATPEQRQVIEPWLIDWANAARAFFYDRSIKRNNHWYWLGLGLAATSIATEQPDFWENAQNIMEDAARDIQRDGTLPLEVERQVRALYYHAFAAMPLVIMAEIAAVRGHNWYELEGGALHKLVSRTLSGLANPASFEEVSSFTQELRRGDRQPWAVLYQRRFPSRAAKAWSHGQTSHRWLGGDVLLLEKAIKSID